MKIPAAQFKQVQSMGRANIGSVGAVVSGVSAVGNADRALANHAAKVAKEYIRRDEVKSLNDNVANVRENMAQWTTEYAAKKSFSGKDLEGRVKDVKLFTMGTDQYGDPKKNYRENIPAHEVYPQLLAAKLQGEMDAASQNIINPLDRESFVQSRRVYNADTVRSATLKASDQQYQYNRSESDVKRKNALLNGDIEGANFLADEFEGTDFERQQRREQNAQGYEVYQADELIRIEDVPAMVDMLNYLKDEGYTEKGGPLPERKNIELQDRLKRRIGSMAVRKGATDKRYKAEIKQQGQDFLAAQLNGELRSAEDTAKMRGELQGIELFDLDVDIRRAEKISPLVDALYKIPVAEQGAVINQWMDSQNLNSGEAAALRKTLANKGDEISKRIAKDANGVYQERNFSEQLQLGQPGYFAKSVARGKDASNAFNITAKPLLESAANQLGQNFKNATIGEIKKFITSVLAEVPEKADQDALFSQVDQTNDGNLNVYADMMERGDDVALKAAEEGNRLRSDPTINKSLIPSSLAVNIAPELSKVFPNNSQMNAYLEAVLDHYAFTANEDGDFNNELYDETRMRNSIKAVVGNIVEYNDRKLLLPNNDIDAGGFEDWRNNLPLSFIDKLGGIDGMDNSTVLKGIRDEDITFWPSKKRGHYLLQDIQGNYLQTKNTEGGKPVNFTIIYDRNAVREVLDYDAYIKKVGKVPKRNKVLGLDEFKEKMDL